MRAICFLIPSLPALALAHPGHTPIPVASPLHYLATVEHAGGALVLIAVFTSVALLLRRPRRVD